MQDLNDWQIKLLYYIRCNGNVNDLIYDSYTMNDVVETVHEMVKCGILCYSDSRYCVTPEGDKVFQKSRIHEKGMYKYMFGDSSKKIDSIDINDVYIPRKRKIEK